MINKNDLEFMMEKLKADFVDEYKRADLEDKDGMIMTIHFYINGKDDSEEISYYQELDYRLLDTCIVFLGEDTTTYFAYDSIEQIYIDHTG